MFIYYFVHLSHPIEVVERRLLGLLDGLDGWARVAYREGEELRARVGVGGEGRLGAKTVRLRVGPRVHGNTESAIPITWEATGAPGLFPKMDADLVMASLGPELTQLALRGSYQPPLGALGRALDRMLLHRVAEASVKAFVDRIARAIEGDSLQSASPSPTQRGDSSLPQRRVRK